MLFNSFSFLLLFPIIYIAYWVIPTNYIKIKNIFLLVVSYLLYMNWNPSFALILLGVTLITYFGALVVSNKQVDNRKKLVSILAILALSPLLVFKYYNFLNESVTSCLAYCGLHFSLSGLNYAIPIGISFFTFQAVGYLLDTYNGRAVVEKDFLCYALFVSFFPQVTSGPISTAQELMPQFKQTHRFNTGGAVDGLRDFLWGIFLKVAFADRLGVYVDAVFNEYEYYDGGSCLLASLFYSFQIYGDFAGYSLMAVGIGKLLGFNLINNFAQPYFASSVTDFWKRWHISLTRWLTTHVYIGLGGNRCSKLCQYRNILLTFLVSGLWHGASWTFVIWGLIHGILQILEKRLGLDPKGELVKKIPFQYKKMIYPIRVLFTFLLITVAWIFFRMPDLRSALGVLHKIFIMDTGVQQHVGYMLIHCVIFAVFFIKEFVVEFQMNVRKVFFNYNCVRWVCYLLLIVLICTYGILDSGQFIYVSF